MPQLRKFLALTLLLISSTSVAGAYIGGNVGSANTNENITNGIDDDDTGFKIYIGGNINEYLALEGYYAEFGKPARTIGAFTYQSKITGFGLDIIGKMPVSESFRFIGSLGAFSWDEEYFTNNIVSFQDDGVNAKAGVGFQFDVSETVTLRLEYDAYFIEDSVGDIDVTMYSAGLQYNF